MQRKYWVILFITIAALNFFYAIIYRIEPMVDARAYDRIAQNIVAHGLYAEGGVQAPDFAIADDPAISRVGPGYEYFLAGLYSVFGRYVWLIWLIQSLMYAATVVILGHLSIRLMPEWGSVFRQRLLFGILLLFGVFIDAVQLNAMLMTESLALSLLALISWFLYAHIYSLERATWKSGAALGALLGLAILTRTNYVALLVPLATVFFYYRSRFRWGYVLAFFVLCLVVQAPWIIRNYQTYNAFVFHTTAGGNNLFVGNYPSNHGVFYTDFPESQFLIERYKNPVDLERAFKDAYKDFVIQHPIGAIRIMLEKSFLFFSLTKTSGFWFHYYGSIDHWATVLVSILQNAILLFSFFLFVCMSMLRSYRERKWVRWEMFLVVTAIFLVAPSIATIISNRYRLLLLVVYIPALLYVLREWSMWPRRERLTLSLLSIIFLLFATGLDVLLQFDKVVERIFGL
jgi:hypothetical protein